MKLNQTILSVSIMTFTGLLSVACGGSNDSDVANDDDVSASDDDTRSDEEEDPKSDDDNDMPMGMGGMDSDEEEVEEVDAPPIVESTNILNGATAVHPDSEITIEFSEPMDRKSVEDAYDSKTLPPDEVAFSWSDDWRTLTITPNAALEYASAKSIEALSDAPEYSFIISKAASGDDGELLEEDYAVTFTTARRVSTVIEAGGSFVGSVRSDEEDYNTVHTGDSQYQDVLGDAHYVATVNFNLSGVHETAFQVDNANLSVTKEIHLGNPFDLGVKTQVYSVDATERSWAVVEPQLTEDNNVGFLIHTIMTSYRAPVIEIIEAELQEDRLAQFAMVEETLNNDDKVTDAFKYSNINLYLTYWME